LITSNEKTRKTSKPRSTLANSSTYQAKNVDLEKTYKRLRSVPPAKLGGLDFDESGQIMAYFKEPEMKMQVSGTGKVVVWFKSFKHKNQIDNNVLESIVCDELRTDSDIPRNLDGVADELRRGLNQQRSIDLHIQNQLLPLYRKWKDSKLQRGVIYAWVGFKNTVGILNSPREDPSYSIARADLECFPKVFDLLLKFENALETSEERSKSLVDGLRTLVRKELESLGLVELNDGGRDNDESYSEYNIMSYLLVKHMLTSPKGQTKIVMSEDGRFCLTVPVMVELAWSRKASKDPTGRKRNDILHVLRSLESHASALSIEWMHLEESFRLAENYYQEFLKSLQTDVISHLELGLPIPNNGKCSFCIDFRKGETPSGKIYTNSEQDRLAIQQ